MSECELNIFSPTFFALKVATTPVYNCCSSPTEWSRLARLKTPTGDRLAWTPITPKLARKLISQRPLRRLVPIEVEAWLADLRAGDPAISDEPVHRSLAELKRELMSG